MSEIFRITTVKLEQQIPPLFADKSYGCEIERFVAGFVAMGSPEMNARNSKGDNKVGSYKDPFTGEKVKFMSFALPFDPKELVGKDQCQLEKLLCEALYHRLDAPNIKIPKDFDYETFAIDMKAALQSKV